DTHGTIPRPLSATAFQHAVGERVGCLTQSQADNVEPAEQLAALQRLGGERFVEQLGELVLIQPTSAAGVLTCVESGLPAPMVTFGQLGQRGSERGDSLAEFAYQRERELQIVRLVQVDLADEVPQIV